MGRKKLLIASHIQFGYLTEVLFYCSDLRSDYDITYLGFDFGMKKIAPPANVEVIYVERSGGKLGSYIQFIKRFLKEVKSRDFALCLLFYFTSCSLARILSPGQKMVVDIRTSFIFRSKLRRNIFNSLLWFECLFFRNITIISHGLKKFLRLKKSAHVVPLGGEALPFTHKNFTALRILYVGTFYERYIEETIPGVAKFIEEFPSIDVTYNIIGYGPAEKIILIKQQIESCNELSRKKISYLGEVRYPQLKRFLDESNVGICYVPLEPYYEYQPPTKTFEYLLSGMVVIATKTYENRQVINHDNGVIIGHSSNDVYLSLKEIAERRESYNSLEIRNNSMQYTWQHIIDNNLRPYLNRLTG